MTRSPIVSVVWQLRFEEHLTLAAPETVLRFQELLGGPDQFAITLQPKFQLSVQAPGPAAETMPASAAAASGGGWRLSARDGSWQVSVDSTSLAVETTRYGTWEGGFLPRLQRVLDSLKDVGTPVLESRLGLRYINVLTGSAVGRPAISAAGELSGLVSPWLLGALNEPLMQDSVQTSQGRAVLSFEQVNAIINYGVVSTETSELGFLIDIDTFREGGRALRIDDVITQTGILHCAALGLFQWSLTSGTLEAMRSSTIDTAG